MFAQIKFLRSLPNSKIPTKGTTGAAGFDLVSADVKLEGNVYVVNTGLRTSFPEGYVLLVYPRSGLARRLGLHLVNGVGVIDSDYRGDIQLMMRSSELDVSTNEIMQALSPGSRVAQAILTPLPMVEWTEVSTLDDSVRGTGGFGSTGEH